MVCCLKKQIKVRNWAEWLCWCVGEGSSNRHYTDKTISMVFGFGIYNTSSDLFCRPCLMRSGNVVAHVTITSRGTQMSKLASDNARTITSRMCRPCNDWAHMFANFSKRLSNKSGRAQPIDRTLGYQSAHTSLAPPFYGHSGYPSGNTSSPMRYRTWCCGCVEVLVGGTFIEQLPRYIILPLGISMRSTRKTESHFHSAWNNIIIEG